MRVEVLKWKRMRVGGGSVNIVNIVTPFTSKGPNANKTFPFSTQEESLKGRGVRVGGGGGSECLPASCC